jgi:hypothetical protein
MIATVGSHATLLAGDALTRLIEAQPTSSRSFSVQCSESTEQVWERMEARGIPWLFYAKELDCPRQLVSLFFLAGDKLCRDAKECLQGAMAIPKPATGGVS